MKIGVGEHELVNDHELKIDSGCLGHVCPPRFAPRFLVTSASNIKAVAANDVALRTETCLGSSRDDEQWQTSFDTNHVDLMSVRKSLLSAFALKRPRVTIIFSHDHDRIIFRRETVNLVSHDCHSHLDVRFDDGSPLRKAMVMTGESVLNDVDHEVYEGDSDEASLVREASDADRRAIADADQARHLDTSSETETSSSIANSRTSDRRRQNAAQHDTRTIPRLVPSSAASRARSSTSRRVVVNQTAFRLGHVGPDGGPFGAHVGPCSGP